MKDQELLNNIRIASPCPVSWDTMTGDEKVRFCSMCKLNVYNISSMTVSEAANTIREKEGKLCVQLRRRRDGTIITEDCPVGLRKVRNLIRRCAVAATAAACWFGIVLPPAGAQSFGEGGASVVYSDSDSGTRLGGSCFTPEALRKIEEQERMRKSAWLLTFPALTSLVGLAMTRKRRNRSIAKVGITLAAVIGLTGFVWGLYVMGVIPDVLPPWWFQLQR